ncbi:MAG: ABC transporter ATP-binding protein [Muribaculaceae bacterium]|nr:ABC transporter ATP-binding protein [Muribaculaceae bacterium]
MIRLHNFSIGFGTRKLLDSIDCTFSDGRLTALIGRNGSGKSTMLRAIAGLDHHYQGDISLDGTSLSNIPTTLIARRLAFVNTHRTRIPNMRCIDVVALGRAPYTNWIGHLQTEDLDIVQNALKSVGMADYSQRPLDTLSDGECQRVMIARAIAQDTPGILLDEPTSFLDLPNRYELVTLLQKLAHDQGKCIIFSTHELDIALRLCDDIALIDNGSIHHLPASQMASSPHLQRLFPIPL